MRDSGDRPAGGQETLASKCHYNEIKRVNSAEMGQCVQLGTMPFRTYRALPDANQASYATECPVTLKVFDNSEGSCGTERLIESGDQIEVIQKGGNVFHLKFVSQLHPDWNFTQPLDQMSVPLVGGGKAIVGYRTKVDGPAGKFDVWAYLKHSSVDSGTKMMNKVYMIEVFAEGGCDSHKPDAIEVKSLACPAVFEPLTDRAKILQTQSGGGGEPPYRP
jgi:hypothetical protein